MFRTVFSSIIRSSKLCILQRYMANGCCYLLQQDDLCTCHYSFWIGGDSSSLVLQSLLVREIQSDAKSLDTACIWRQWFLLTLYNQIRNKCGTVSDVHGFVHRKYTCIPIYIQQDAALHSLFISGNCSTCFGCYFHPSSGAQTTVSTASGICHTVTATSTYRQVRIQLYLQHLALVTP
jgi:hypothetical protein